MRCLSVLGVFRGAGDVKGRVGRVIRLCQSGDAGECFGLIQLSLDGEACEWVDR